MKKRIKAMAVSLVLLFSVLFTGNFNIKTYANEITEEIYNEWKYSSNGYMCPTINANIEDMLMYCHSIVEDKKGILNTDKTQVSLVFEYTGFDSVEVFSEYVQNTIFYPFMAAYTNTSYTSSTNVMYAYAGSASNPSAYYAIVNVKVNGGLEEYCSNEDEELELATFIYQLADEARQYSSNPKEQMRYIYNYLRSNVTYGSTNGMRAHTPYGALIDNLAVCQGYSMVIKDVCYILDIPCIMNFSNQDNHGWNSVFFNGKWNFIDATNGHFCDYEESEIAENLTMYHFDSEMICMVQDSILKFNGLNEFLFGDVDKNGEINSSDALNILNCVIGNIEITDEIIECSDIDGNGVIDSHDALEILNITVK